MNKGYIDAVVVVDMQEGFLMNINSTNRYSLIAMQLQLIEACKKHNVPVIALQYEGCGKTTQIIAQEIERNKRNLFLEKNDPNGFDNPELKTALNERGAKNICLTGVYADACVRNTGLGALENKFRIYTANDLITDVTSSAIESARRWFNLWGTCLPTHRDAINYLAKDRK